ncbi:MULTISPECIES: peptidoglycan-binding protein [unclassified Aurantimonas]|uniref:peptidoglycan-binding protein n=1 Tax=unclassified Aurantimonas TaxID=2638230 RepID=UPI002E16D002|nr:MULTISPECIES: peptidoglycan-binding protein [unclassified Aurantimonas]MEC5289361.1 peptidoglycan-binding protein [Aurantimonas sp. C2-3-R2]MEC5410441.1 peptidoglycan-binding protein [Aurantimonas sp. C2-4-R8]
MAGKLAGALPVQRREIITTIWSTDMTFERWLQSRLTAHGYTVGLIDGIIGPITLTALKAFEKANGLTIDGTADPAVVKALRASSSAISPKAMTEIPNRDDDDDPAIHSIDLVNNVWPRQRDVPSFYGGVGTNQTAIEIPFDMVLAWSTGTRIKRMTLHKKVAPSAERVLQAVAEIYSARERADLGINLFAGSLNVRRMRGGRSYSMHSWGIAIDFDSLRNSLNTHAPKARLSHTDAVPFWQAWEAEGWLSLGRARDYDWMHIQAARL